MFTIPALFSIVLKNANKTVWSDRKKVSVGLAVVLHEDSLAYLSDTTFNKLFTGQNEKATLFCTIFIKCFLLSGHSLSDGCLIIETTVNAMMIPPVDIVLGFKG